jgi:hypothetical protein
MRIVLLMGVMGGLLGCSAGGESWARDRLGKAGAEELKREAESWAAHSDARTVESAAARCPSPRVVIDVYPPGNRHPTTFLEYSRVSRLAPDVSLIKGPDSVRCLVLAQHAARGKKRSFQEWMDVRLVDREAKTAQLVRVRGNDDELAAFLAALP